MGRQPMRHALHPTNNCPAPLDSELLCKFQFVGMGRQPMRHALHPTNDYPAPLDSELLCKFQFIVLNMQ